MVGSKTIVNRHIPTSFVVEALEYLQAVVWGIFLGIREVLVEGDALSMTKRMWSCNENGSVIGAYIHDAKKKSRRFHKMLI